MPGKIVLPSFSGLGVKIGVKLRLTLRVMRGDSALGLLSWGGAPGWVIVLTCCACGRRGWRGSGRGAIGGVGQLADAVHESQVVRVVRVC